ncbi:hypothetical protein PRIPAC_77299 [Pristionchus pacificus]|uniref:Uncharacterized protein n=1 Tax=Pristionchus pacificus TaxID=54126 RepID=A0A454XQE0_PRIPA|nr:hypothetical protein PRIPAC_77299 [Pristionchus pacificus]|eukprot:PDM78963.1 hypothetical protein PRIPAC_31542 [Pristionchus pacificus]
MEHTPPAVVPENSVSTEISRELETLSALERLPQEIVLRIFGFVPEALLDLRQTSRMFRSRADEYALQADKLLLVEDLNIDMEGAEVELWAYVPSELSPLFERRIKLLQFPISLLKREGGEESLEMKYVIKYDIDDHDSSSEFGMCMGKQIGKATLQEDNIDPNLLTPIFRVLDGIKIRRLEIKFITLCEDAAKFLLSACKSHPVEQLSLAVWNVSATNRVDLLLELSSLVKSLHIDQNDGDGRYDDRFLFGEYDRDWEPIILEMLSRRCDKLHIDNRFYQRNLGKREVDALRELIPKFNKPVWFEATCVDYPYELEYEQNSYSTFVGPTYPYAVRLSVKHCSRVDEDFE